MTDFMSDTEMAKVLDGEIADAERAWRNIRIEALVVAALALPSATGAALSLGLALWFHSISWGLAAAACALVYAFGDLMYRNRLSDEIFQRRGTLARKRSDRAEMDES